MGIRLDSKGNICDESTKMFYESVLDKKKEIDQIKKKVKASIKCNVKDAEKKILQKKSLFNFESDVENSCNQKRPRCDSEKKKQNGINSKKISY